MSPYKADAPVDPLISALDKKVDNLAKQLEGLVNSRLVLKSGGPCACGDGCACRPAVKTSFRFH